MVDRCPICNGIGYTPDQIEFNVIESSAIDTLKWAIAQLENQKSQQSQHSGMPEICISSEFLKPQRPICGCHGCHGNGWIGNTKPCNHIGT